MATMIINRVLHYFCLLYPPLPLTAWTGEPLQCPSPIKQAGLLIHKVFVSHFDLQAVSIKKVDKTKKNQSSLDLLAVAAVSLFVSPSVRLCVCVCVLSRPGEFNRIMPLVTL